MPSAYLLCEVLFVVSSCMLLNRIPLEFKTTFSFFSITVFISSMYNNNINHYLEKKTQISRFQFKKSSFCWSYVLDTFL